jgi:hypothetical protein
MKLQHRLYFLISCLVISASISNPEQQKVAADPEPLKTHVTFLADDVLEGRATDPLGHEIASRYIAAEFAKSSLMSAGDDGSYLQEI